MAEKLPNQASNTFHTQCGLSDANSLNRADCLCNEYGVDPILAGSIIALALECFENGVLAKEQTGGMDLKFGDGNAVATLIEKIARREGIGDLLAEGPKEVAIRLQQSKTTTDNWASVRLYIYL